MAEYTEFLRVPVTSVANTTYVQAELKLPTVQMPQLAQWNKMGSKAKAVGLVLHAVEVLLNNTPAAHFDGYIKWHLSKRSESAILTFADPNVITCGERDMIFDTNGATYVSSIDEKKFYPPVLLSNQSIYFGFYQNSGATISVTARIHYTLREIDAASYINALVPEQ